MLEYEAYHVHSSYSNCLTQPDSTMTVEDYAKEYRKRGMHVLCLSEHGNRSNAWEQFELANKYSDEDFKMIPIASAECYFVPNRDPELKDGRNFHLIVSAQDMDGFRQLNRMLSDANMTGFYRKARVDFDLLSRLDPKHFLVTTACVAGPLSDPDEGEKLCCQLHEIFRENFYLEIQHHPQEIQVKHNAKILQLYRKYGWPLIYATDSHYINREDAALRKELILSAGITYEYEDEFCLHLPTAEEAFRLLTDQGVFSKAQIEEAFENTLRYRDFPGVSFDYQRKFPISRPDLTMEQRNELYISMVKKGYVEKFGEPTEEEKKELTDEMNTIVETNSADYFIGLTDMIQRGIEKGGVLTTTSRGSACGFATNAALGLTTINRLHSPVRMFPARFISKEKLKVSMPDEKMFVSANIKETSHCAVMCIANSEYQGKSLELQLPSANAWHF